MPVRSWRLHEPLAVAAVHRISEVMDAMQTLMRIVPWNVRGDSVQSTLQNHLHYVGMQHDETINLSKTRITWMKDPVDWTTYDSRVIVNRGI